MGPEGDPVPGGTARIIQASEPRTLDPAVMGNSWAINSVLGNALYGTLMIDDPEQEAIAFMMAESFSTQDGGTTFELRLRPNLQFSDGTPLDAAAVKFNWDRMKEPSNGSPYVEDAMMIASNKVVEPTVLEVTMRSPIPHFAYAIVETSMNWIASPAALTAGREAFDGEPIGAGPFVLERWARQDVIELVKNPTYWDAPKPYLDRILVQTNPDTSQRYNTLISGGADLVIDSSMGVQTRLREQGYPSQVSPLHGGQHLTLNTRRAPFDDVRARRAVAAAIDVQTLDLALQDGMGEAATSLFRESSPYYAGDLTLNETDHELAQRLFDELAGEGKPVSFTFVATQQSENRTLAESIQAQLSAFENVTVNVEIVDIVTLLRLRQTYGFDMMVGTAHFTDPDPRLWTAFHGASARNTSGINDEQLNAALDLGRTSTNLEKRTAAYRTVQERLNELVPAVFTIRTVAAAATGKNVGGLRMYTAGSVLPEELWIAE
ncbi:MAG: ABC transporter substrate-binding protein [Nocardia sp.]|nr:ABC transporter substrate-binding protein [Nocardia sp.]